MEPIKFTHNPNNNVMLPRIGNTTRKGDKDELMLEQLYLSCYPEKHHFLLNQRYPHSK